MTQYDSILDAINGLQKRGFTYDFNIDEDHVSSLLVNGRISPGDFKIVEVYRFEGESDSSESSVVYAIESFKYHIQGYLVDAYGIYSDTHFSELTKKLKVEHHEVI